MTKKKTLDLANAQSSTPATETLHIIKDNLNNTEIEMGGKEWAQKQHTKISLRDIQTAKESLAEGEILSVKAAQNRYEWLAYKQIATDARLTFADAQIALKNGLIKKPSGCSTC